MAKASRKNKQPWLIVANWKMNPSAGGEARALARASKRALLRLHSVSLVLCPPFPYLALIKPEKKVFLGAQDCHFEEQGAFTGSVSPNMLKDLGARYVILGHSERRAAGETSDQVAKKVRAALRTGLTVILCVGEQHRDQEGNYLSSIKDQLKESLIFTERQMLSNLIIAYEPVWAIGGKATVVSHDVHQAVIFLKKVLSELYTADLARSIPILYGGSSNASNTEDILKRGGVAGLLVGSASLSKKEFGTMLTVAESLKK